MTEAFHGAKIALICGDALIAYRRDDTPGIPNPGLWDLPGGGREGDETPEQTTLREVEEEFGLALDPACISWRRRYPSVDHPGHLGWFLVGALDRADIARVRFGDEGERWEMMPLATFLDHPRAVPALRARLADYLDYSAERGDP
jgi:8-oxo-dGTP diphosphatase